MSGSESKSQALQKAHADAYRAYLRSLRDSLAKIDIEAVDVARPGRAQTPTLFTFYTTQTWFTYYTHYTYGTFGTQGTIATESCGPCIE